MIGIKRFVFKLLILKFKIHLSKVRAKKSLALGAFCSFKNNIFILVINILFCTVHDIFVQSFCSF